ncbi:MAG: CBS domain-containing protein [Archaeoglobales archaeon]|nr:CBS domain-containing protein [Archaeoglobales archaeon]
MSVVRTDLPVKEIMTREVCTISKNDSVHTLAKKMLEFGVGSAVVIENGKPVGIVTEKDLIAKVVAKNKLPSELRVYEIMSEPLITITPLTSLKEAARLMIKRGIRRLPVVDNSGTLVGIITDNDILSVSIDLGEFTALILEHSSGYEIEKEASSGICEKCGKYTDVLINLNGLNVCEDCAEIEEDYEDAGS